MMVSLMLLLLLESVEERIKVESRRVCGKYEVMVLVELWKVEVMFLNVFGLAPLLSVTVTLKSDGATC